MKRTPLKRPRARWSKGTPKAEQAARERFIQSCRAMPCAGCHVMPQVAEPIFAHHVVEAQELRSRKLWEWDLRDALPLCDYCHQRHHNASRRIPFRKLRPENVAYAYEVLGDYAGDYLRRFYPMSEESV